MLLNGSFGFGSSSGGGSGSITGAGTPPKVPKFTAAGVIGDSQISDNGVTVFIGDSATSTKALFEVKSTTHGVLFPNLTTTERDLITVGATENSLFIFNTSLKKYQYYDSIAAVWQTIESSTIGGETLTGVLTNGNTFTTGQFLSQVNGGGAETWIRDSVQSATKIGTDNAGMDLQVYASDVLSFGGGTYSTTLTPLKIGSASQPNATSILDIVSTTKGILIPRMTTIQKNAIVTPAQSLLLYDLDLTAYYYYDNATWNKLLTTTDIPTTLYSGDSSLTSARTVTMGTFGLTFSGNQTTFKGFGATSATTSLLVQNSVSVDLFRILDNGYVGINITPTTTFHVNGISTFESTILITGSNSINFNSSGFTKIQANIATLVTEITGEGGVLLQDSSGNSFLNSTKSGLLGDKITLLDGNLFEFKQAGSSDTAEYLRIGANLMYVDIENNRIGINGASTNSLFEVIAGDIETTTNTTGLIVLDRTNGNRYRIYTDGGILFTELVV